MFRHMSLPRAQAVHLPSHTAGTRHLLLSLPFRRLSCSLRTSTGPPLPRPSPPRTFRIRLGSAPLPPNAMTRCQLLPRSLPATATRRATVLQHTVGHQQRETSSLPRAVKWRTPSPATRPLCVPSCPKRPLREGVPRGQVAEASRLRVRNDAASELLVVADTRGSCEQAAQGQHNNNVLRGK